jgi:inosine/xanthosine triphosphate pyrophosphatase family protein
MARVIVFLTTNEDKYEEIAGLLEDEVGEDLEVDRATERLPIPPSSVPGEVAKFRALEAFKILKEPVFAEALAIELADGALSGASFRQAFEAPGGASSWLTKHDGKPGTARVAVGYTADGKDAKLFEAAIRGTLVTKGRGHGNAPWERHWIPDGHTQTLAELAGHAQSDEIRNGAYLQLAKALTAT